MFESIYCRAAVQEAVSSSSLLTPEVTLNVTLKEPVDDGMIRYIAAAPADHHASYSGSGLPFPNASHAFYGTPNRGEVRVHPVENTTTLRVRMPNSYYAGLGTVRIPPKVYLTYTTNGKKRTIDVQLSEGIPYRSLTYPMVETPAWPRKDAMFYSGGWELPVRTQEQVLRDSAYPSENKMHSKFWGLKPPM